MTAMAVADAINRAVLYREELADGSTVWVAEDPDLDGCMAQGDTREEALAALEENRRRYLALQHDLRASSPAQPAPVQAPSVAVYDATVPGTPTFGRAVTWAA